MSTGTWDPRIASGLWGYFFESVSDGHADRTVCSRLTTRRNAKRGLEADFEELAMLARSAMQKKRMAV